MHLPQYLILLDHLEGFDKISDVLESPMDLEEMVYYVPKSYYSVPKEKIGNPPNHDIRKNYFKIFKNYFKIKNEIPRFELFFKDNLLLFENESRIVFQSTLKVEKGIDKLTVNFDYSLVAIGYSKVFEIEINLSVIHWVRNLLAIEMPQYFNKVKGVYQQSSTKTKPTPTNRAMEHKNQIGYITNFTSHPWGGLNYFYPYSSDMGFYIDWRPSGNALHPNNFTNTGYDQYYFVRTDHTLWTSVTNLGVSYRINNSSSSALMIYGGIGNARTKTYSGYLSSDGEYFYYEDGERISKINLNFGVLRQTNSVISWQVGFDSAVKGINFGIGYTWE